MPTGHFQGAHNFSILKPKFIDNSNSQIIHSQIINQSGTPRLKALLAASIPDAFHDSSARDPPPKCHPGTRCEYINTIVDWGLKSDKLVNRILWLNGPAGVGKSAVAQSCAEALGDKLGAAFFFSEFNHRQDPNRLFTSISYQLAVKLDAYGDIVDHKTNRNPTLVQKAPKHQFQELIVAPLRELAASGKDVGELVIIVDGLDECAGHEAQCNIIKIIAESVRDRATSLLWAFFSRPEAHITAAFSSPQISPLSFRMELPVSDKTDAEITLYLKDELGKTREEHGLPASWPSEQDIRTLAKRSAGLFIYAAAVVRFINEHNSTGPEDQLQSILVLRRPILGHPKHPLSELDSFYTLIMRRVPPDMLPIAQKIMLVATLLLFGTQMIIGANLLNLTESQYRNACRSLHSILKLTDDRIKFYHASFIEFLQDPERSGDFCIKSHCAVALRSELLDKLNRVHATSTSVEMIDIPITWPEYDKRAAYEKLIGAFFNLCQSVPLDTQILARLSTFNYAKIPLIYPDGVFYGKALSANILLQKIPKEYQGKLIRPYRHYYLFRFGQFEKPEDAKWNQPYVLGRGKNKILCWEYLEDDSIITAYPKMFEAASIKSIKSKIMG